MPYTVELSQNQQYIHSKFMGNVTIEDVRDTVVEVVQLLDASEGRLHVLTDLTDVKTQPSRVAEIWSSGKHVIQHPKIDWWVIVGINNPILEFIIRVLTKLGKTHYREFKSREEGLAFLASVESPKSYN